jgi:alkane 1-monooxygenase
MTSKSLKYLIAYLIPLAGFVGLYYRGYYSFSVVAIAFVLIPLLEFFTPNNKANLSPEAEKAATESRFFDYLLYVHVPSLYALLAGFFYTLQTIPLQTYEVIGLTLSVGILVGSFGINIAHELGHRSTSYEQLFAKALLLPSLYMHFNIEHNRGHHKNVATPADPSSARKDENLYAFWWRTVTGAYKGAWALEAERLRREGKAALSFSNEMIWFQGIQLAYLILVGLLFGWAVVPFAIAAAVVGFLLLESVNYIEHYGLSRKKLESGWYETVQPKHSWNSNHELGRIMLYELTRHSDHHYKADRKYQILRYMEDSPQLPYGYPTSILIALLPPLWFRLINPRLSE